MPPFAGPPQPVDDLAVTSLGYNETDISLTWGLGTNEKTSLIITKIEVIIEAEDAENNITPVHLEEVASDVTEYTYTVSGAGKYIFTVTPHNDFSADVEGLSSEVTHEVKPTTKPPTNPPTTKPPPTEPPPVAPVPQRELI